NYLIQFRNVSRRHSRALRELGSLGDDPEHVAVILASIVEKEAVRTEEMPLIAGVFLNRLLDAKFKSHLLQADPTVSYGCVASVPLPTSCTGFTGKLGRSHLGDATNPYNTYQHPGLPPGPISNPGIAALEAVLDPADTKYMYFVARGNGTHQFSTTLEQHKAAVKKYRDGD
ncbi:MAG: endolytic transglycosylase MltG, partial [Deltaproteobacteria bacterium]|nr:endolytic transglycosylase MltG [Deltaproteobacteria bacterium]